MQVRPIDPHAVEIKWSLPLKLDSDGAGHHVTPQEEIDAPLKNSSCVLTSVGPGQTIPTDVGTVSGGEDSEKEDDSGEQASITAPVLEEGESLLLDSRNSERLFNSD